MNTYRKSRERTDQILRRIGVIVVMNRRHVRTAGDLVTTMWEVYQAGFVAECTFRIDAGIIREAMSDLTKKRAESPADNPFLLGVGSVINPDELESAIALGFDLIVSPADVMSGRGEGRDFVRACRQADVFSAPAVFTPTEFQYFLERSDGLEPDAIKIFPAGTHGPNGLKGMLAPFARARHAGRMIVPTGGVDSVSGPKYQEAICTNGFHPVLGMSSPLALVEKADKPGDPETIRQSLVDFKRQFNPFPAPRCGGVR